MKTCLIFLTVLSIILFSFAFGFSQPEKFDHFKVSKNFVQSGFEKAFTDLHPDSLLDSFIKETMSEYYIPGVSTCIVYDGQIVWDKSYGYANIEQDKKVTNATLFLLASISKTFAATALMQLWEDGLFGLDDNINDYLPPQLQVINPEYPNDIITFRQLLTHTSSIDSDSPLVGSLISWGSDCPISLESYLVNYFMPSGSYYSYGPFNSWAPGTKYEYCNTAFALIGYLVELLADTSFEDYCQKNIFTPLGMDETSWFLSGLDTNNIAMPYYYTGGTYHPYGQYGIPDYPAGQLRTSSAQLARFMIAYLQMGEIEGVRILDSSTVDLMTTVQYPEIAPYQGLAWGVWNMPDGNLNYYHWGAVYGCRTFLECFKTRDGDNGIIALTNGTSSDGLNLIYRELDRYAWRYKKIYAYNVNLNSPFMQPGVDTLKITTQFFNVDNHNFTSNAIYTSIYRAVIDSIPLFDDGNHFDMLAEDGIWGNQILPISVENEFMIDISTVDLTSGEYFVLNDFTCFTTIGPVVFDSYTITSYDTFPNPGNRIRFQFFLKNEGLNATAKNITTNLICLDTCASLVGSVAPLEYGDIAPAKTSSAKKGQYILFSNNSPTNIYARFRLDIASNGYTFWTDTFSVFIYPTSIHEQDGKQKIPSEFVLHQNYPNPFNAQTIIEYQLPKAGQVRVDIYNLLGQRIIILVDKKHQAGRFNLIWDGKDSSGRIVPSGVYFYRLETENFSDIKKMLLLQ